MGEWREYKISDIADVIGGGTPKTSIEEYWNGDIPWLSPRDLTGYDRVYISHGDRFITEKGLKKSSAKMMPKGSILLTSRAPIGYVAIAENEICTNQGFKSLIPREDISNSEFLYYWIKNKIDYLQQLGTGTTFAEISGGVIKGINISLPPLKEQKAIAEVLSSLDDKIDLLHRQNKTLEEMAQTLFRQWFIEEADEGWEVIFFNDLVDISSGKSLKRTFFNDDGKYEVLGANGVIGRTDEWLFDEKLIFTGRVGTLGNIFINDKKAWLSDNTLVFKPKEYFYYIYFLLKSFKLENYNVGSTQPLIRQSDLKNIDISLAPKDLILNFEKQANDIFIKINQNKKQIKTLENTRDTLLPKLMSGEVRIKDE